MLEEQGIGTRYYSLSDELREEAKRREMEVSRPVLRAIANQLRLEHGSGVLSLLVVNKLRQDLSLLTDDLPWSSLSTPSAIRRKSPICSGSWRRDSTSSP